MALPPTPQGASAAATAEALAAKGQGLRVIIWTIVFGGTAMMISLPTVMLIFFGLLPSIVAGIIDRSEQKYAMFCVFGMNISGLFPYLMDIWFNIHNGIKSTTGTICQIHYSSKNLIKHYFFISPISFNNSHLLYFFCLQNFKHFLL